MAFEPKILRLAIPINNGNKNIEELVFNREMCAGDLRGDINIGVPTYDNCLTVASRITSIPEPILRQLVWRDFSQVVAIVMGFFNDTPQTGEKA